MDDLDTSFADIEHVSDSSTFTNAKLQQDSELLHVLDTPFAGRVSIDRREIALQTANSEYAEHCPNRLVFWSDASVRLSLSRGYRAGISIVWRGKTASAGWQNKTYTLHGSFSTEEAEFFGIAEAMKLAARMIEASDSAGPDSRGRPTHLVIYTDSQSSLRWVRDVDTLGPFQRRSITRQRELAMLKQRGRALVDMGVDLELKWVPGHAGVAGNSMADHHAGLASKSVGSVFGGLRFDQLQPVADAYLQSPPGWATRIKKTMLKRQQTSARQALPRFNMRLRSAARVTNSSLRRSASPSHQKESEHKARLVNKRMEKFQKMLQMQIKEAVTPGSRPVSGRNSSPIARPLTRDVVVNGITKKVAVRLPPPPPLPKPRTVPTGEDSEEIRRKQVTQPQKSQRAWDRLKVLLRLGA